MAADDTINFLYSKTTLTTLHVSDKTYTCYVFNFQHVLSFFWHAAPLMWAHL